MTKLRAMVWAALMVVLVLGVGVCEAQNRDFILENQTGHVIVGLYVRTYNSDWSADFLGSDVLFDSYQRTIQFARGNWGDCRLYIKVAFLDGTEQTSPAENLCATGRITWYDGLVVRN